MKKVQKIGRDSDKNFFNVIFECPLQTGSANLVETPLIEVSEEEDSMAGVSDNNSKSNSEKSSSTTTLSSTNSTIRSGWALNHMLVLLNKTVPF